jgi:cytochrome b6-f complex iron-sulfur subunit
VSCSRREFLRCAACGGAAAALASLGGCAPGVDPAPEVDVPAPAAGRLTFVVAHYPDLDRADGAVRARAPGVDPPILVARTRDGGFAALLSVCTHKGCPLGVEGFEVVCPCHASRFDLSGQVTHPPAVIPLATYPTSYDAASGALTIVLSASASSG